MPPDRRSGSISALLPLAFLCTALCGCDADGETGTGSPGLKAEMTEGVGDGKPVAPRIKSRSVRIPPLPEPFDSTGCYFHGATYRPHPDWVGDGPFAYLLRTERIDNNGSFYEAGLVFEARDRRSGALATSLRMEHTTGNGLARHGAYTENGAISVDVLHINRDLGAEAQGDVAELELPAPYALQFTDLQREIYYRHDRWDDLGEAVTYHTPARMKPYFPNRWLLQSCGGP